MKNVCHFALRHGYGHVYDYKDKSNKGVESGKGYRQRQVMLCVANVHKKYDYTTGTTTNLLFGKYLSRYRWIYCIVSSCIVVSSTVG